jgi:methylphosphotriester-DNA--protein-cysteine methyltransferase
MTSAYHDNTAKWAAVQRRDPASDGSFVYAVRTTKIYCRPVCTARVARRGNVEFFGQPREAEGAGYRACKRCKPQGGVGAMPEAGATARIRALIQQQVQQPQSGDKGNGVKTTRSLAQEAQVSKWHFHRRFKEITGLTPSEYFNARGKPPGARCPGSSTSSSPTQLGISDCSAQSAVTGRNSTPGGYVENVPCDQINWLPLFDGFSMDLAWQQSMPSWLDAGLFNGGSSGPCQQDSDPESYPAIGPQFGHIVNQPVQLDRVDDAEFLF